jgi:hypothetical protein
MRARLIDVVTGRLRPVSDALALLLDDCRRFAAALGCTAQRPRRVATSPARLSAELVRASRTVIAA